MKSLQQLRLQQWISKNEECDGFLATKPENIFWLSEFRGSFGLFFQTKTGSKFLITDARYAETAKKLGHQKNYKFLLFDKNFQKNFGEKFKGRFSISDTVSIKEFQKIKTILLSKM